VVDKLPSSERGARAAQLNRWAAVERAMKSSATVLLLAAFASSALPAEQPKIAPTICQVTRPNGGLHENASLAVGLYTRYVFRPGGQGFVDSDGALGIKVLWTRKARGQLQVGGKRLDGHAPPARAYISDLGETGIQPSYLLFPTPGCWQITGHVGEGSLTFVVLVEKVGDGPAWRMDGPEQGFRVSSIAVDGA
jgi:hypothetical protein